MSAKLAAGPARQMAARENGDGGRLHRRTAPQAVRHRACTVPAGQPNDEKVSALMYSRRQQENGEHAALIRAPERSHEHKKAVTDLNPAHSAR